MNPDRAASPDMATPLAAVLREAAAREREAEANRGDYDMDCTYTDNACGCLAPDNSFRVWCISITNQAWFDQLVLTVHPEPYGVGRDGVALEAPLPCLQVLLANTLAMCFYQPMQPR